MISSSGFLVKQPGILSLIQDGGRFGAFNIGLTNGGPLDKTAFQWANKLCGNALNVSAVELSIGGLSLVAQKNTVIAVTGAQTEFTINGVPKALWRSHRVQEGDILVFGYASKGVRNYLAVKGGFDVSPSFGSTSTVCREGVGGLNGTKIMAEDVLPYASLQSAQAGKLSHLMLPQKYHPSYGGDVVLHTIPSYQQHHFSAVEQRLFFGSEYQVSTSCDRMGYRLEGKAISCDIDGILSEGICHGAIQIPSDGQPIILLNDRQTIGGYPKIGAVTAIDTAKLTQLSPGDKVRFEPITMEQAHNNFHLHLSLFKRIELECCE
ncbi:MAG: biotin-dependent carboxyltransferase family protein [Colwellia sp.]